MTGTDALVWAAHAAISAAVTVLVVRILAGRWLKRAVRAVQQLHRIAALLDTSRPGGLTDLEDAIREDRTRT